MKQTVFILLAAIALISCDSNTYSNQREQEKRVIKEFIKLHHIEVVTELPADTAWGENVYYQVPGYDDFYYHLSVPGDSTLREFRSGDKIILRYNQYTLTQPADTAFHWTTLNDPYAVEFKYWDTQSQQACTGWHEAIELMRYPNAQCKIICPSKLGFNDAQNSVTPFGYDLYVRTLR